jgi:hypothetical protein
MLSPIFCSKTWTLKFQIPSKIDWKQNDNLFQVKFVGKVWTLTLLMYNFLEFLCCIILWLHFGKATFEVKLVQILFGQKFTHFYIHNFSETQVLLVPNPIVGYNNNFIVYLWKIFCGEWTHKERYGRDKNATDPKSASWPFRN